MKTPLHRRVIYITFIAIFLIASPLVILFTMGYRYNLEKGRVQKTGIIKITSQPRGATIFLNDVEYQKTQTPAKIEYQLPGDYEIKLVKDGYYDWQKKLPVYENITTFAEKVMLWKKSNSIALASSSVVSWLTSPDGNMVIASDSQKNISLLDINSGLIGELTGGKIEVIANLPLYDKINLLEFSPSGRYVLAQTIKKSQIGYLLIDTLNKTTLPILNKKYVSIRWKDTGDELYALDSSILWQLELGPIRASQVRKLSASDFYINGKTIYYIKDKVLIQENLSGENSKEVKRVTCQACLIKSIKSDRALIADSTRNTIAIIDISGKIKSAEITADKLSWLDGDTVLLYNNFEIYIYDFTKPDPELITRLGAPITSAIWHPQARHLIFSTEGKTKLIELDNREIRNIITIADVPATNISSDRSGKNLFFSSTDKIYRLNLQ